MEQHAAGTAPGGTGSVVTAAAIWDEIEDTPFELLPDKPFTLAAYVADMVKVAYVNLAGVGDELPEMPAYLDPDSYVPVPLDSTYQATWDSCPEDMRELVERGGVLSDDQED